MLSKVAFNLRVLKVFHVRRDWSILLLVVWQSIIRKLLSVQYLVYFTLLVNGVSHHGLGTVFLKTVWSGVELIVLWPEDLLLLNNGIVHIRIVYVMLLNLTFEVISDGELSWYFHVWLLSELNLCCISFGACSIQVYFATWSYSTPQTQINLWCCILLGPIKFFVQIEVLKYFSWTVFNQVIVIVEFHWLEIWWMAINLGHGLVKI